MRPGLREIFPGMGGGIDADKFILPARRRAFAVMLLQGRGIVETLVAETGTESGELFFFAADQPDLVWTNDTTRATAIDLQDGIPVKHGDSTRRYLGTYYTTATGQTEDSVAKRMVWNQNNRTRRQMRRADTGTRSAPGDRCITSSARLP